MRPTSRRSASWNSLAAGDLRRLVIGGAHRIEARLVVQHVHRARLDRAFVIKGGAQHGVGEAAAPHHRQRQALAVDEAAGRDINGADRAHDRGLGQGAGVAFHHQRDLRGLEHVAEILPADVAPIDRVAALAGQPPAPSPPNGHRAIAAARPPTPAASQYESPNIPWRSTPGRANAASIASTKTASHAHGIAAIARPSDSPPKLGEGITARPAYAT